MNKQILLSLAGALTFSSQAATAFSDDFSASAPIGVTGGGVIWAYTPWNIDTAPSSEMYWGQYDNVNTMLTLGNLPAHSSVTVSFDFYMIQSWDGDQAPGPDFFSFGIDGTDYINDTFSIFGGNTQSYPVPGSPGNTGADAFNTLGFPLWGDRIYELSFTIPHSNLGMVLDFAGRNLQGVGDEGWGIDNIVVEVNGGIVENPVPEVQTYATVFGAALIGLQAWRRRGNRK